jgi:hypothetical protein
MSSTSEISPFPGSQGCGCNKKKESGCGCSKKCGCQEEKKYSNATGPDANQAVQNSHMMTGNQTGVIILSCAVIIAFAIMSKK